MFDAMYLVRMITIVKLINTFNNTCFYLKASQFSKRYFSTCHRVENLLLALVEYFPHILFWK